MPRLADKSSPLIPLTDFLAVYQYLLSFALSGTRPQIRVPSEDQNHYIFHDLGD